MSTELAEPNFERTFRAIHYELSDRAITISSDLWMEDEKRMNLLGLRLLRSFAALEAKVQMMSSEQVESEFEELASTLPPFEAALSAFAPIGELPFVSFVDLFVTFLQTNPPPHPRRPSGTDESDLHTNTEQ